VLATDTDIHFRKTATQSCCTWRRLAAKKRFGGKKQIFGMKSQATIFNPF